MGEPLESRAALCRGHRPVLEGSEVPVDGGFGLLHLGVDPGGFFLEGVARCVDALDSLRKRTVYEGGVGVHRTDGGEDRLFELSCWETVGRAPRLPVPLP
ncbi:MAG: hypothetical protein ACYCVN_02290 [Acidimicrobiales bacterium]